MFIADYCIYLYFCSCLGPGGEGDKIQKVLPLENSLQVEVFLQHVPVDSSSFIRRRPGSHRLSSHSIRKK